MKLYFAGFLSMLRAILVSFSVSLRQLMFMLCQAMENIYFKQRILNSLHVQCRKGTQWQVLEK